MRPSVATLRLGYLTNQYPKVSHSFIRREIRALEAAGHSVDRYALRGWDGAVVDADDRDEQAVTRYTLARGLGPLLMVLTGEAARQPGAMLRALRTALAMARPSARPWPVHLVYLAHAAQLRAWLRARPVDHLHAHFGTNPAEVALLLRLLGGPPFSFTVHGPDEIDDAKRLGLDRSIAAAVFVAAISHYTKSQLMRRVPAEHWSKIQVVHCGLPEAAFAEDPVPLPAAPRLLCIGRFSEQKGHLVLLDAMATLLITHPAARLTLAGDGELRALIEARIAALGIGHAVAITGWIDAAQVRSELQAARILVQPSFMEGLPVVIMEALAQHRPVISTYVAGIPELVTPEVGWLVPAGDADGLARAMVAALNAPDPVLTAMGAAGAARVRARHDIGAETAKLARAMAAGGRGPQK